MLSQWRGYANDGQGVSIGINKKYLNKIKNRENLEFLIYKVNYDLEKQNLAVSTFVNNTNLSRDLIGLVKDKSETSNSLVPVLVELNKLLKLGIEFKNPSFVEEAEIRIVHGNHKLTAEPDMFEYRFKSDDIVSYVPIPLELTKEENIINEVIIGPKCRISPSELKYYLKSKVRGGLNILVRKSSSSYR